MNSSSLVCYHKIVYPFFAALRLASWALRNPSGCGRLPVRFGAEGKILPSCKAVKSASSTIRYWLLGSLVALIMPSSHARLSVSTPILALRAACLSAYTSIDHPPFPFSIASNLQQCKRKKEKRLDRTMEERGWQCSLPHL